MHGEDLDAVFGDLDLARFQTLLDVGGRLEKGEQSRQGGGRPLGVVGHVLGKGVEMFASGHPVA